MSNDYIRYTPYLPNQMYSNNFIMASTRLFVAEL